MILGIYSDLHSNLPAMDSMLREAGAVDHWICVGDSVGLFPPVNEVLDRQIALGAFAIRGDHEALLVSGGSLEHSFTGNEALARQRQILTPVNQAYLAGLPDSRDLELDGMRIHLTHHLTPANACAATKYRLDHAQVDQIYGAYDFVFFGHTHLPALLHCRTAIAINPGSAGFPVDRIRRPCMLRLDTTDRSFDFIRFDFESAPLIAAIRAERYNPKLIQYLENGNYWS